MIKSSSSLFLLRGTWRATRKCALDKHARVLRKSSFSRFLGVCVGGGGGGVEGGFGWAAGEWAISEFSFASF